MYRQIKRELSGARFSKRVHVSPSRPSWRRINPPLVDGKNRRSKPRTTITGVEKSESRNLCLGKRQNKQLERGLHGTEREKEREREGIGILSAGYKSAHSMSRTSHHRGKTEGGERGRHRGGSKVSERDRLFGYQPENWDVGEEWSSASFQRTGGVHCEKRRPPIIVLTRAEQEVATIPGQQAGFKEEFLRRIWPSCFVTRDVRMDELCFSSRDFLLFFFFYSFSFSLSLFFFFSLLFIGMGLLGISSILPRSIVRKRVVCWRRSGEWMRGWWVCLEF